MSLRIWLAVAALGTAASPAAHADEIYFHGKTTAKPDVVEAVVKQITDVGVGELDCNAVETVDFKILPPTYAPPAIDDPAGPAKETYERWTVSMCGQNSPFLIGFWRATDGAAKFRVIHPFP